MRKTSAKRRSAEAIDATIGAGPVSHAPVLVDVDKLAPHPRNYQEHPEDQVAHIAESIRENGFYRNVVVANDNTILAGHGSVLAAKRVGLRQIPVVRLDLDPEDPRALKVLAGDNEIGKLSERDDRALVAILREIGAEDVSALLGTGFDESMLAALDMVTRPPDLIRPKTDAEAEWTGMPAYEAGTQLPKLVITFESVEDRDRFLSQYEIRVEHGLGQLMTTRWPWRDREDLDSVKFDVAQDARSSLT